MIEIAGWIALGLAAFVSGLNFYLVFLRYPLHRLMGREKPRFVSYFPLFGTVFLAAATACLWGRPWIIPAAVIIAIIDTGGIAWFPIYILWAVVGAFLPERAPDARKPDRK